MKQKLQDIKQNIILLKTTLLDIELWCLQYIILKQKPLTTRQIYVGKILNTIKKHKKKLTIDEYTKLAKTKTKIGIQEPKKEEITTNNIYTKKLWDIGDYINIWSDSELTPITFTKFIRISEKILREHKIKYPSYAKILNALESLEEEGMITKRIPKVKTNANFYWILNHNFYNIFSDKIEYIIKL